MKFEEEFPSFSKNFRVGIFAKRYISEYCLDKQKVKEAIFQCTEGHNSINKKLLLNLLGLDK